MRSLANILFRFARLLLWGSAIMSGRLLQRTFNVVVGRGAGRIMSRLWR